MGRRTARKINAGVAIEPWLLTVEQLPKPWDTARVFGRAAPLEVEMGSGKGLFLATAGAQRPEHDFLGIEVARKFAEHAASRVAKQRLSNVRVVAGDGLAVFRNVLADESVAAVHVYFPDPWWKKRHKKRRVLNEAFLRDVERVLLPGGALHFWTDVEEYFQTTLALIAETTRLVGPEDVAERTAEHDLDYRTHFERRVRMSQQPVYRAVYRKQPAAISAR